MSDSQESALVVEQMDEGIVVLRLNRPRASNAVDLRVIELLEEALDELYGDLRTRVVILTGTDSRAFCAGGDLRYFFTLDSADKAREMSRRVQALLHRLWTGNRVVIAAVNGAAIGGGCEVLTACHFRIAASHATFRFIQAHKGITPGWGGTGRLVHLIGRARALDMLLTARTFDVTEAQAMGFIDRVVPTGDEFAAALSFARDILANDFQAVASIIGIVNAADEAGIRETNERETRAFGDCWAAKTFWKLCPEPLPQDKLP